MKRSVIHLVSFGILLLSAFSLVSTFFISEGIYSLVLSAANIIFPLFLTITFIFQFKYGVKLIAFFHFTFLIVHLAIESKNITWNSSKNSSEYISVLTLNVNRFEKNENSLSEIIQDIRALSPTVVCLQEFGLFDNWQKKDSIAESISKRLGLDYFYSYSNQHNIYGLAIFSQFPTDSIAEISMTISKGNGSMIARIQANNESFHIANFHFDSYNFSKIESINEIPLNVLSVQKRQMEEVNLLLEKAKELENIILVGDGNFLPWSNYYSAFSNYYDDAFLKAGAGAGYTLNFPLRIDYQFNSKELKCLDFDIINTEHSDHKMLMGKYKVLP